MNRLDKRSLTSRENGRKSKGPVTVKGKEIAAKNAITHGLTAKHTVVLSNESNQGFQSLLDACLREYDPFGETERQLVHDIANYRWRLSRAGIIETSVLDLRMDRQHDEIKKEFAHPDEAARLAHAFSTEADNSQALSLLTRYEGHLHRSWHRALAALKKLQESRPPQAICRNEPISPKESTAA